MQMKNKKVITQRQQQKQATVEKAKHQMITRKEMPHIKVVSMPDFPWICGENLYLKLEREYPFRKN
jgi:hypothetical protein